MWLLLSQANRSALCAVLREWQLPRRPWPRNVMMHCFQLTSTP